MRTQAQVETLCRDQYRAIGKDPADLIQVEPLDRGWDDALSYEITRNDHKRTRIYRRDLDEAEFDAIRTCLRMFT